MIRAEAPLEKVPMFVRGGAIIPHGPQMNYVGEKPFDPITFAIYPDEKGSAATMLYEDDGLSPAYQTGVFRRTHIEVRRGPTGYRLSIRAPVGNYNPGSRKFSFLIKSGPARKVVPIVDNGKAQTIDIR